MHKHYIYSSNTVPAYCSVCRKIMPFYHVDIDYWECDECGHVVESPDDADDEYKPE